jgi:glycosyltransferase involved in cell wall biosynthesis
MTPDAGASTAMTPRRLLFATSAVFYPDSDGGAERSLLAMFGGLVRRGWQVQLVCGRSLRSGRSWTAAAASLARLRLPPLFVREDVSDLTCWRGLRRFRGGPGWLSFFDARVAEFRPDLVLGYNNLTCPLLRRAVAAGLPSFFMVRSLANLFAVGRFVPDGVRLIANSPFTAAVALQALGQAPEVVLPPVDVAAYAVERRERRYVTFVNPMPEKGVDVALAVARAMPETSFLFVNGKWGDRRYGDLGTGLRNVESWNAREDMRSVYAVTDVLLVPSQVPEAFGRVVVEAHASGIPVVAAAIGGLPYTLGQGGLLVSPKGDVRGYVDALRRLRADPELYARLSAAATANGRRPEFAAERQVDRFVEIVEAALAPR